MRNNSFTAYRRGRIDRIRAEKYQSVRGTGITGITSSLDNDTSNVIQME